MGDHLNSFKNTGRSHERLPIALLQLKGFQYLQHGFVIENHVQEMLCITWMLENCILNSISRDVMLIANLVDHGDIAMVLWNGWLLCYVRSRIIQKMYLTNTVIPCRRVLYRLGRHITKPKAEIHSCIIDNQWWWCRVLLIIETDWWMTRTYDGGFKCTVGWMAVGWVAMGWIAMGWIANGWAMTWWESGWSDVHEDINEVTWNFKPAWTA